MPHTVPPFEDPHVPSAVTFVVGVSFGSPVIVADAPFVQPS